MNSFFKKSVLSGSFYIFFVLLFVSHILTGQTDTIVRFVPPVVIESPPDLPPALTNPSVTLTQSLPTGSFTPEWMIIKELNIPLNKASLHEKTLRVVNGGEAILIQKVGKQHFENYFKVYKDRILSLDKKVRKQGYFGRESRIIYYYEIVYEGHLIGTEMMMLDTTGNPLPEFYNKPRLSAYKALFDGELTVSCEQALKKIYGEKYSGVIYNISLKCDYLPSGKWNENQKHPEIWWEIWENGCTICKEGKVDARDVENYKIKVVNRNEEMNFLQPD